MVAAKRKRAGSGPPGKGSNKAATSKAAELENQLRNLKSDPYKLNSAVLCRRSDHVALTKKQKAPKHCATNPRCLYGLGEGRDGIWAKKVPHLAALGQDPALRKRQLMQPLKATAAADASAASPQHATAAGPPRLVPVGLRNLGATCYLNAQLQCLFHLVPFRRAVYNCQLGSIADLRQREVVSALQLVFGHMQAGSESVHDLSPLAKLLELNTGEQQDPSEFNALFMHLLERCLRGSDSSSSSSANNANGSTVDTPAAATAAATGAGVADLFRIQAELTTVCSACGKQACHPDPCIELRLNLKDSEGAALKSVAQCLQQFLQGEPLTGDNQYFCDACNGKRDARREQRLRKLPPILTLQLVRFEYDFAEGRRRKLRTSVHLDPVLMIPCSDGSVEVYDLHAVLHHRGTVTTSGHYVAEVLDPASQRWFMCDDESVGDTKPRTAATAAAAAAAIAAAADAAAATGDQMDVIPVESEDEEDPEYTVEPVTSKKGSKAKAKGKGKAPAASSSSRKQSKDSSSSGVAAAGSGGKAKGGSSKKAGAAGSSSSTGEEDAYMLVYCRRGLLSTGQGAEVAIPESVAAAVATSAVAAEEEHKEYQQKLEALQQRIADRRMAYTELFGDPEITPAGATAGASSGNSNIKASSSSSSSKKKAVSFDNEGNEVVACEDSNDDDDDPDVAAAIALSSEDAELQQALRLSQEDSQSNSPTPQQQQQQQPQQHPGPSDADIAQGRFCLIEAHWLKQWIVGQALALPPPKKAARRRGGAGAAPGGSTAGEPVVVLDGSDSDSDAQPASPAAAGAGAGAGAEVHDLAAEGSGTESSGEAAAIAAVAAAEGAHSGSGCDSPNATSPDAVPDAADASEDAATAAATGAASASVTGSSSSAASSKAAQVFSEPLQHSHHLCPHGKVHPTAISKFKLVTETVYLRLVSECGGPDPPLTGKTYRCDACVAEHLAAGGSSLAERRCVEGIQWAIDQPEPDAAADARDCYALSKQWERDFKAFSAKTGRMNAQNSIDSWLSTAKQQQQQQQSSDTAGLDSRSSSSHGSSAMQNGHAKNQANNHVNGTVSSSSSILGLQSAAAPDPAVNAAVTCPHGRLVPAARAWRRMSSAAWRKITDVYGGTAIEHRLDSGVCAACKEAASDESEKKASIRDIKSQALDHSTLKELLKRKQEYPIGWAHDQTTCMVPHTWLEMWRDWHNDKSETIPPPPPLNTEQLRCEHGLALLPELTTALLERLKISDYLQPLPPGAPAPPVEFVTAGEWGALAMLHSEPDTETTSAAPAPAPAAAPAAAPAPTAAAADNSNDATSTAETAAGAAAAAPATSSSSSSSSKDDKVDLTADDDEPTPVTLRRSTRSRSSGAAVAEQRGQRMDVTRGGRFEPEICARCTELARQKAEEARSTFVNKELRIVELKAGQTPPTGGSDTQEFSDAGRPKRSTRATKDVKIVASSSDSLAVLKVKIYSATDVSISAQILHHNGNRIDTLFVEAPLSSLSIRAGDTIHVAVDPDADCGNDEAALLAAFNSAADASGGSSSGSKKGAVQLERGFQGSALMEFQQQDDAAGSSSSSKGKSAGAAAAGGGAGGSTAKKRGSRDLYDLSGACEEAAAADDAATAVETAADIAAAAAAGAASSDSIAECSATVRGSSGSSRGSKKRKVEVLPENDAIPITCNHCGTPNMYSESSPRCSGCKEVLLS